MNSKLTSRGYTIRKNKLNAKDVKQLSKDLVVSPYVPKDYPQPDSYPIYLESPYKYYIPRYYGIEKYGEPDTIELNSGNKIKLEFNGKLREIQVNAKNKYMESINENYGGGILCLKCGQGKTVLGLNIVAEIGVKTLIIVHKEFLANQWIDRIKLYLPEARIGKIQGSNFDIQNKDICVAMLQTLCLREYEKDAFNSFGLLIIDEVHHMSSEVFSRALLKINLKYTLGLTATPKRTDGLTHVFLKFLGPILYKYEKDTFNEFNLVIKHISYKSNDEKHNKIEKTISNNICISKMINNVVAYDNRNELITYILKYLSLNPNRNVILLSDRKDHLKNIYEKLNKDNIENVGYYVGGMKQNLLDKVASECKIILSTYAMAAEALDIPKLNCLLLSTSKVNVEQSVGRILRQKHPNNSLPMVIDIEDMIFKNQYKKRLSFYKSNNYAVHDINITNYTNLDNIKHLLEHNTAL